MRKVPSLVLVFALTVFAVPTSANPQTGIVKGVAHDAANKSLSNVTVRIRDLDANGQITGATTTGPAGDFSFTGLQPGHYVVEIVNNAGEVVGTSTSLAVAAGATVSVTISATALGAIAAAAAGGGLSLFGLGPLATVAVLTGAGAATITGLVVAKAAASPSR